MAQIPTRVLILLKLLLALMVANAKPTRTPTLFTKQRYRDVWYRVVYNRVYES